MTWDQARSQPEVGEHHDRAQMLYRSNGRYNAMGHHLGCTIEMALSMNIINELPAVVGRILKNA